jgi:resolvase-like protein
MPSTNGHGSENSERVALYMRVSSEEQRDRETIEIQREFLQEYCRLYGLEVAQVYADDGLSGTIPLHERPEGGRLLEDAKSVFQNRLTGNGHGNSEPNSAYRYARSSSRCT